MGRTAKGQPNELHGDQSVNNGRSIMTLVLDAAITNWVRQPEAGTFNEMLMWLFWQVQGQISPTGSLYW